MADRGTSLLSGLFLDSTQPELVRFPDAGASAEALLGSATAVADRVRGAPVVAVRAEPTLTTAVAIVGCLVAGTPVVPVPPDAGPLERHHILADSGAVLVVGPEPWEDVDLPIVPVDAADRSSASHPIPEGDEIALVLYTSGTTGPPKGVELSYRAIAHDLDALARAWDWTPADVLVHGLPMFHVHGLVLGLIGSIRVGNQFIHTGRPTPAGYAGSGGSLYFGVPTVWSRIVEDPPSARALSSARLLVSGSAALPIPVFEGIEQLTGHTPIERYGMTETLITLTTRHDGERRPGWVGQPLDGVEVRLGTDDGMRLEPSGDETFGELQVRGPTLFAGYRGRPEATRETFTEDGWFRTGDGVVVDARGSYRIVGRQASDIIKTGGYRVGAAEVESALLSHPAVREAAVVGIADPDLGQRIVAFVVAPELGDADLIHFVATQLSWHKRPRQLCLVTSLPRNAMGKVVKSALMS